MGERVTSNTKCVGDYLRSLVITAIVTFSLPLMLLGGSFLLLTGLKVLLPEPELPQQAIDHLQSFLGTLGSGDSWEGALLVGTVSCLVGLLFDTYANCRYRG